MNKTVIIGVVVVIIVVIVGYFLTTNKSGVTGSQGQNAGYGQTQPSTRAAQNGTISPVVSQAASSDAGMMSKDGFLVDSKGMTLYTYDKDTKGVSNCEGECLAAWPAYLATDQAMKMPSQMSVITRADGSKQYAWNGMPLYYYQIDKKPGDTAGDGVGGIWHIVKE